MNTYLSVNVSSIFQYHAQVTLMCNDHGTEPHVSNVPKIGAQSLTRGTLNDVRAFIVGI